MLRSIIKETILKMLVEDSFLKNEFSDSESSSSDSEQSSEGEEPLLKRKCLTRINNYVEVTVKNYCDEEFKSHFRMCRTTAYKVLALIVDSRIIPTHVYGRDKITAEKAFLLSLWYISNQESFRQVSDRFNMTLSSAHRCLKRILKFFLSIKDKIIKWPSAVRVPIIVDGFKKIKGIVNVIGAIDGSHIEIVKPKENQESYVNRKGYHSILIQAVVDHEKKFIDIFCGEPGSIHDARLLRKSGLYKKMERDPICLKNNFILGDSAYPNLRWLVTPLKDNGQLTRQDRTFNYKISATRVVVENAFGLLKGRFRRLKKLENIDLKLCSQIVMVACILHNICLEENDLLEIQEEDYNQPQHTCIPNNYLFNANISRQRQLFNDMLNKNQL